MSLPTSARRLVVIDEEFRDFTGHSAAYNLPLGRELARRGRPWSMLAHRDVDVVGSAGIVGLFDPLAAPNAGWLAKRFRLLRANFRAIAQLLSRALPLISTGDVVVLARPVPNVRIAYAVFIGALRIFRRDVSVVYTVHNTPDSVFRIEARLHRLLARKGMVRYVAHSPPVARQAENATGIECAVVPLPFDLRPLTQFAAASETRGPRIATYFGLAHRTKGFDLLVDAIPSLAPLLLDGRLKLVLQAYLVTADSDIAKLVAEARTLSARYPGIELIETVLDDAQYRTRLAETDIVILPHRPQFYAAALSGAFTEALGGGKPVVVSSDTYMAAETEARKAGVVFAAGNAESLAAAIAKVVEHFDALSTNAQQAAGPWRATHSASAYLSRLDQTLSSSLPASAPLHPKR